MFRPETPLKNVLEVAKIMFGPGGFNDQDGYNVTPCTPTLPEGEYAYQLANKVSGSGIYGDMEPVFVRV